MHDAWVGIDVAFAKRKRLPVVICVWENDRLIPFRLRGLSIEPPRGSGNLATLNPTVVRAFSDAAADYIEAVCEHLGVVPARIALDAPSGPRQEGTSRRAAEAGLDRAGISCFTTPTAGEFERIHDKVRRHVAAGGAESRLPHANQLWMMVGFSLFDRLRSIAPCMEVFPQATVRALGSGQQHKFRKGAVQEQLAAAAAHTGWPRAGSTTDPPLREIAWAPAHDCLDAYLSAWVAALPEEKRIAFGEPPDDAIWIPRFEAQPLRR